MIAILQRIASCSVTADGAPYSECGKGLLVLLGVSKEDTEADAELLAAKISKIRIFTDSEDKLNLSVADIGGSVMVVPNFTLLAAYKKGNRPDFLKSAAPDMAEKMFDYFCDFLAPLVPNVAKGKFRADMQVSLVNDGPITIAMDSRVLRGERDI